MSYWVAGPWSKRKYTILQKYVKACETFWDKYRNFVYVETHGGSGKVVLRDTGEISDGSPMIAAQITPSFPCHIIEIDPKRFATLQSSLSAFKRVEVINGDCNTSIDQVLTKIYSWRFSFFFVDPDGYVYYDSKGNKYDQLKWETVNKIASHHKSEILLNFPLEPIYRPGGYVLNRPDDHKSISMGDNFERFFGDAEWKKIGINARKLLDHYMETRLRKFYDYIGALLIRGGDNNLPLYYLVYCSKKDLGGTIMRNVMSTEWIDILGGVYPLTRDNYSTKRDWLDAEFPLKYFVFEN